MARKKKSEAEAVADDLDGTVEGKARDHFEKEKRAYEERTGEKVEFVPPAPMTRTPIATKEDPADEPEKDDDAEGEGND